MTKLPSLYNFSSENTNSFFLAKRHSRLYYNCHLHFPTPLHLNLKTASFVSSLPLISLSCTQNQILSLSPFGPHSYFLPLYKQSSPPSYPSLLLKFSFSLFFLMVQTRTCNYQKQTTQILLYYLSFHFLSLNIEILD